MRNRGGRGSNRVQRTRAPARGANTVQSRTLTRIQNINFSEIDPNGGVRHFGSQRITLDDFLGSESIQSMYEQYKFSNVQLFMKPSLAGVAGNYAGLAALAVAGMQYTDVQSFIDYDTVGAPTSQELEGRSNLKSRALPADRWTKIADFRPKVLLGAYNLTDNSYWISTSNPNIPNLGCRFGLKNSCSGFNTTTGQRMQVQILIRARIQLRGLKTLYSTTFTNPPPAALPPVASTENSEPDSDSDGTLPIMGVSSTTLPLPCD